MPQRQRDLRGEPPGGPEPTRYHNLPLQPTPLIGREQEIAAALEILDRPEARLLTLVGPPGIGKTRLGIEIASRLARDFEDGAYFVPLSPITEPSLVLPAIAQTLGVKEVPNDPLPETLANYLRNRHILLVLDNFEQVIEAAAKVSRLVAQCAGLKAIATSREHLSVYGEHDYPVPPFSVPTLSGPNRPLSLEALSRYEAIELFVQRAQAVSPGFRLTERNARAVAEICVRLDGLPLAIELAAARVLVLSPEELLARLKSRLASRLKLLKGGASDLPARQRTLQDAIDWSYNVLDPAEQALFGRLGVFVGGFTLEAIEQVCGGGDGGDPVEVETDTIDVATSLIRKSLVQRQEDVSDRPRFMMLETIREYARQKLEEGGELDSTRERHFDYFLRMAESAEQETSGSEQALWFRRLDAEENNMRAALEWCLSPNGPADERGLRLAAALTNHWDRKGYFREWKQWCTELLARTESRPEGARLSVERARVLTALARTNWQLGDSAEARSNLERSLEMYRLLGNDRGLAGALISLGSVAMWQGEYDFSRSLFEECLAIGKRLGNRRVIANALSMIGVILMRKREYQAAVAPLDEALAIDRDLGSGVEIANTLTMRGSVAIHLGEYEKAKALIEEGLGIAREQEAEAIIAFCLARLGMIALRQGEPRLAETFLMEGLARVQGTGIRRWSQWYLVGLAEVARLRGMPRRAARLIGASDGVLTQPGANYEPATRDEIDRIEASVRAELAEESFQSLRAEGQAMSLEKAEAYAAESDAGISTKLGQPNARTGASTGAPTGRATLYPEGITKREAEVLGLIAAGKSNQEIAQELVLSLRTVERHISNIYQKIGATGRAARASASAYAVRHGITAG